MKITSGPVHHLLVSSLAG